MMAPDELQGTVLEHADLLQKYAQANEKMVMYVGRQGLIARPPTPWTWDTLVRTVLAGQSLVWKIRTLALLDEEIIAIDVEAWVTLQTIAALRRVPGRRREWKERKGKAKSMAEGLGDRRQRMGQREGTSRERNRQREDKRRCDPSRSPMWANLQLLCREPLTKGTPSYFREAGKDHTWKIIKHGAGIRWWRREELLSWRWSTCSRRPTETWVLPSRAPETGRHVCWPGLARKTKGGVSSG